MNKQENTSGVQELINKLSQEGVTAGEEEAAKIVSEAQAKANDIVEAARREAAEIVAQGRQEAEQFQAAANDALRLAARDSVREFGSMIHEGLRNRLQELVQHDMEDPQLLRRLILEITREATDGIQGEQVEILLPAEIITEEEAKQQIESGNLDPLTEFIEGLIGQDLRENCNLGVQHAGGLKVRCVDRNIEIDLTDEAITDLLAKHMLPRFRALMRTAS